MKIDYLEKNIIIYLYKYKLNLDNIELLSNDIKNLFIKLIRVYKLELSGLIEVTIYENVSYGYVLEIRKLDYFDYQDDIIDLKINILNDCDFYFKCDDYFLLQEYQNVYYKNNCFYVNIKDINNLLELIEHGNIVYNIKLGKEDRVVKKE